MLSEASDAALTLPGGTHALARRLIGMRLVRQHPLGRMAARIVETEAYPPGDMASHAFRGLTQRCASMFRAPGHAYVYLSYGTWMMLNVSAEPEGTGAGVLVRAAEPLDGIALMEQLRGTQRLRDLARGPGRLAVALGIDRSLDGIDMTRPGPLTLEGSGIGESDVGASARIGITRNPDAPWRYYLRGSPFVSGPRALSP